MLTKRHLIKSARMMSQFGESRPGFLDHDASLFKGPDKRHREIISGVESDSEPIVLTREIVQDEETGELKFDDLKNVDIKK